MNDPLQIVVVLDVAQTDEHELSPLLPDKRHDRLPLRLSKVTGIPPALPGAMKGPYDWDALGRGVEALADEAQRAQAAAKVPVVLYVAGRAPLPLFVHLGYLLNKFSGEAVVLNPLRGGPWKEYPLTEDPKTEAQRARVFFDVTPPKSLPRSPASGRVAVYVSTLGAPAPEDAFLHAFREHNAELAGLLEIRTSGPGEVTGENMPLVAKELYSELPRLRDFFPRADGLALFVAGPASMAFAAGRALNFHAHGELWLMNYDSGAYELAITLPFRAKMARLPDATEDTQARGEILKNVTESIEALRRTLRAQDLALSEGPSRAQQILRILEELRVPPDPDASAFFLSIASRELRVGAGLLEALRRLEQAGLIDAAGIARFAQLFVLHELYHDGQDLRSSNYQGIGRAGVVLEEVDYWADNFALATLVAWNVREHGTRAARDIGAITARYIDTAIAGIEAFDRLDQGDRIDRLYERRLRRYLIWHLQHERAKTVRTEEDVALLFRDRLFVEIAPLEGLLDTNGDKLIRRVEPQRAEVFAVRRGHLVRHKASSGLEPTALVEAVRSFDRTRIREMLKVLVEEHRRVLVPWVDEGPAAT